MAVFDHNGNMVGVTPHVRDVGPHGHAWVQVGSVGPEIYSECTVCGARTCNAPVLAFASRRDWLAGGGWEEPEALEPATPEDVRAAIDELNEAQRSPSDEHRAAMPTIPVLSDPIRDQQAQAAQDQERLDAQVHEAAEKPGANVGTARPRDDANAASPPPAEQAEPDSEEGEDGVESVEGEAPRRRGRPRKAE